MGAYISKINKNIDDNANENHIGQVVDTDDQYDLYKKIIKFKRFTDWGLGPAFARYEDHAAEERGKEIQIWLKHYVPSITYY